MKRKICMLLCALLLFPVICAAEDTSHTDIAALMARQVSGNSTLRAQLTAELSEQTPAFLSADTWQLLRALTDGTALETTYVFSRAGETLGNSQGTLYLKRGEETLSTLRLSGRGGYWQLWGDALEDKLLTLPRDTSLLTRDRYLTLSGWGAVLLRGLGFTEAQLDPQTDGQWPALYRFFAESATETDAWKEQAGNLLQKYTDQISSWMQEGTKLYLTREANGLGTRSELKLTGAELAQEALTLLDMFYHDEPLLNLLRQKMTDPESRSYLEPGMIQLYEQALKSMELPENLLLTRRYDPDGNLLLTSLRLPLANGAVLSWENDGRTDTLGIEKGDSAARVGVEPLDENSRQGSFSLRRGGKTYEGSYQLFVSMEPVYEDENETGRYRRQNGTITLLISPSSGENFSAQALTITLTARAGLQNDQPAHWNADLDWQETDSGACAHIHLKTRTGAAIQQTEAQGTPTDLTQMKPGDRLALLKQALSRLQAVLTAAKP